MIVQNGAGDARRARAHQQADFLELTLGGHHDAPLAPDVPAEKSKAVAPG
jgi:hypothetical protein